MFNVNAQGFDGCNPSQISDIKAAIQMWVACWNSQAFQDGVLNFGYLDPDSGKLIQGFYFTDDETVTSNRDVFDKIMRNDQASSQCTFTVVRKWTWPWSDVIAWTDYDSQTVTLYPKFFDQDPQSMANTLSHEAGCHCAGFEHSFDYSAVRDLASVPYAIGNLTERLLRATQ